MMWWAQIELSFHEKKTNNGEQFENGLKIEHTIKTFFFNT